MNRILTLDDDEQTKRKMRPSPGQPFSKRWFDHCLKITGANDPYVAVERVPITPLTWATYVCCWAGWDLPPQVFYGAKAVIPASIQKGCWVVDCPLCGSPLKSLASKRHPVFWCVNCHLKKNNPQLMDVRFPGDADRIEYVLCRRPQADSRNWLSAETLQDLVSENHRYGVR